MKSRIKFTFLANGNLSDITDSGDKIFKGQVAATDYYLYTDELTTDKWLSSDLVYINFRRPDNQTSQVLMTRSTDGFWIYTSNGWETDCDITEESDLYISFTMRRYSTVGSTTLIATRTTEQMAKTIYPSSAYIPQDIESTDAERIDAIINQWSTQKMDRIDATLGEEIPSEITYNIDGEKTANIIYFNYEHAVTNYDAITATVTGDLLVVKDETLQAEYLFATNGKVYFRTIGETAGDFQEISKAMYDVIDARLITSENNSSEALSTANEAKAIALNVEKNKVFGTFTDMEIWLKDEDNKGKHSVGLVFLIKDDNKSEYWVSEVLETPNESGYYYNIKQAESSVYSVNGQKGAIVLKTDDILDEDEINKFVTAEEKTAWNNKVDKETGKGLSTNDYTTVEKEKVSKVIIDGDGKQALLNDGTYGEVGKIDTLSINAGEKILPGLDKNIDITVPTFRGDYSDTVKYYKGDCVYQPYSRVIFMAKQESLGNQLPDIADNYNNDYWVVGAVGHLSTVTASSAGSTMQYVTMVGKGTNNRVSTFNNFGVSSNNFNIPVTTNIGTAEATANLNIKGNLNIDGNIVQNGSAYETHAEHVYTTKDEIVLRDGAVDGLAIGESSGLLFKKYDGTNDGSLKVDKDGVIRVGDVGDEQPLATREETPLSDGIAQWDEINSNFKTTSIADLTAEKATKLEIPPWNVPYRDVDGMGEPNSYRLASMTSPLQNAILIRNQEGKATFVGGTELNQGIVKSQLDEAIETTVKKTGDETIAGIKTFDAPENIALTEQSTLKVKTANGGAVILGKQGPNSGSMIRLDQVDGTPRLRFRSSSTPGAMVWEQLENNSFLAMDLKEGNGTGRRIEFWANKFTHPVKVKAPTIETTTITDETNTINVADIASKSEVSAKLDKTAFSLSGTTLTITNE